MLDLRIPDWAGIDRSHHNECPAAHGRKLEGRQGPLSSVVSRDELFVDRGQRSSWQSFLNQAGQQICKRTNVRAETRIFEGSRLIGTGVE
jgi:hypothetical protein